MESTSLPLFSILIANYNNGRYLQEAIESVINQSYTHWEIILIDDASTDNSKEIYQQYSTDTRIHILYNRINKGCTYTKWRCVEECHGDICGFLDADDTLMPRALEKMVQAHLTNSDASLITSRFNHCDAQMHPYAISRLLQIPCNETYLTHMDYQPEAFASFKREYYLKTQGLNNKNHYGDDQELYLLLEEVGKWIVLDDVLYNYRIMNTSVSHGKDNYICLYWNIIVYHEACKRRGLDPEDYSYKIFREKIIHEKDTIIYSKPYRIGLAILHPMDWFKRRIQTRHKK
jgi:glycosyltransferase involved in cell wall biosynthesis